MAVYVVTWNLNRETNYAAARAAFIKHLEAYANINDPNLESVRFISTNETPSQVSEYLRQKLDKNDRLFVSRVRKNERAGWLAQPVWDWLNARDS
jgi:hypothetical protein